MGSENPIGAENQQERLIKLGWVIGFVDGEGCFSIGLVRQPDRIGRRGYRTGYQVSHEFAVVQGARSVQCLYELQEFLGVGRVTVNRRRDNHREHLFRFDVRTLRDLSSRIIPFFEANPLRTAKADEFRKFAAVLRMMETRLHLTVEGLTEIAKTAETMNHRKPSRFLESPEAIRQPTLLDG